MDTLQIITTVGTSMFGNYKQTYLNEEKNIANAFGQLKNIEANKLDHTNPYVTQLIGDEEDYGIQEKFFKGYVQKEADKWKEISDNSKLNINASAEISSIIKIQDKNTDKKLRVYLLASDTVLSMLSAKLIQEWFQEARLTEPEKYKNIEVIFNDNVKSGQADFIPNLRTNLPEDEIFTGFNNLVKKVVDLSKKGETIINITGGYKGFIPILTIIAQIEGLKLNYLYEDSDKLIEVPEMSIDFDFSFIEDNYLAFEEIKPLKAIKNLPAKNDFIELLAEKSDFDDLLTKYRLIEIIEDEKIQLTLFGKLLFNRYEELYNKDRLARQKLLGEVVEYKIYEYFSKAEKENNVEKGKSIGEENFDIDIYIERENEIEAIEVKPGGNIPIEINPKTNNTIKYRLVNGSFRYLLDNTQSKKCIFHLIAYFHTDLHPMVKTKIKNLFEKLEFENKSVELKFSLLKVKKGYKTSVDWKVNKENIQEIITVKSSK